MTPEDLEQSRRHAARMSDQELGALYVRGPESWPPEAWVILEQETARRQRARRVAEFTTSETYQGSSDQYGRSEDAQIQIVVVGGKRRKTRVLVASFLIGLGFIFQAKGLTLIAFISFAIALVCSLYGRIGASRSDG